MGNDFLPGGYELPQSTGAYMKLEKGDNKFRVMSSAIVGYEYWTTENKPVRSKNPFSETPNIKMGANGKKTIKHFWAFVVWHYKDNQIKILELTQSTIMGAVQALVKNQDWGDPKRYDITITKTGDGMETEYATMPSPHKPVPQEAQDALAEIKIDLEKLYSGDDPFAKDLQKTQKSHAEIMAEARDKATDLQGAIDQINF